MSRNQGGRPARSGNGVNPLWVGILVGLIVGVGLAAGVTWYLTKSSSPFIQKEQVAAKPPVDVAKPAAPADTAAVAPKTPAGAPGEKGGKPRFEFYKVLTDKQDATVATPPKHAEKSKPPVTHAPEVKTAETKAAAGKPAYEPHLLQAGSFPKEDDAEKLKARLALLGVEATVQSAAIPDKGTWYRVRLGPYKSEEELNRARNFLKQNGVDATPMRAQ